ncbi:hypothetical protein PAMP_001636 [Pampus punctatissimus]
MLRVVVESANGIPKKKLGNPDPIVTVIFRGACLHKTSWSLSLSRLAPPRHYPNGS